MTSRAVKRLCNGLYRLYWKQSSGGGHSLASVGRFHDGTVWMAPSNWVSCGGSTRVMQDAWRNVYYADLIVPETTLKEAA